MTAKKMTVFVVDDEESVRDLLTQVFHSAGLDVVCAATAEEALAILKTESFNVFFIDLLLPGMNGVELCRRIRKVHPTGVIFAMTGYSTVFDIVRCREAGFDDYFPKPFNFPVLTQAAKDAFVKLERWETSP
jgi:DNA-binding response OmpR family regulator